MPNKKTPSKNVSKTKTTQSLNSPKGFRDIISEEYFSYLGFFEKAHEIAMYYGFSPIETPVLEREELFSRGVGIYTDIVQKEMYTLRTRGGDRLALRPEGTAGILRAYIEHGMHTLPQPVMLFTGGSYFRHERPQKGRFREFKQFDLEIIGTDKSIADAIVIKVLTCILEDVGFGNIVIDINSLGDKECRANYKKALATYFRKYVGKLNAHEKDLLKNNPLRLLDSKNPELTDIKDGAPEAMDYLAGQPKQHFKEVLEYLGSLDIPYRINSNLVRGLDYYSRTVFEIKEDTEKDPDDMAGEEVNTPLEIASGGRYDYLAKSIGAKFDVPAVGGALGVDRLLSLPYVKKSRPRILKKPKVFFIQLGFEAKLKSLTVIEILRRARVPITQTLGKDALGTQLGMAENMGIPWVIILGQKEVLENTVIVRNMLDRSQKTIPIPELPEYIKQVVA